MPKEEADFRKQPAPGATADAASELGFSYLDVLLATAILMTGILALLSAMTTAVVVTSQGAQQAKAKQIAVSTMESIFSARDVGNPSLPSFDAVANVGDANHPNGIFPSGSQYVFDSTGNDGIMGTADDGWGPDGQPGGGDDPQSLTGFRRTIDISDVPNNGGNLRQIVVTVSYQVGSLTFNESMTSYMANYTTGNPGTGSN